MSEEQAQQQSNKAAAPPPPIRRRIVAWAVRSWRPAGTVVAITLAMLLTWHVIYGTHGLSIWQQKRAEDRALQK